MPARFMFARSGPASTGRTGAWFSSFALTLVVALCGMMAGCASPARWSQPVTETPDLIRLAGHVALLDDGSRPLPVGHVENVTLGVVLKREDQTGFERWLNDVYDRNSPNFAAFLDATEQADRFGPSQSTYDGAQQWLGSLGLETLSTSPGRLLLTVQGTREAVEEALQVQFRQFERQGGRHLGIDRDPTLPAEWAAKIQAITGLNGVPGPTGVDADTALTACGIAVVYGTLPPVMLIAPELAGAFLLLGAVCTGIQIGRNPSNWTNWCSAASAALPVSPVVGSIVGSICTGASLAGSGQGAGSNTANPPPAGAGPGRGVGARSMPAAAADLGRIPLADGAGQVVAIASFSDFSVDDVRDYLALMSIDPARINRLSRVRVNGGAPNRFDAAEVLLDIAGVWSVAPEAQIVVYDAPFVGAGGSFQALFTAMIDDGVDIITNSFAYCENQTSRADVESIDAILQTAAAAGISVFSASGDTGSICLNGSANTVHVPSSSPYLTAVGGTTLTFGPAFTYGAERWWDGTAETPATGQGGFGESLFFARPDWQDGLNPSPMRSIPDVSVNADPATGFLICQRDDGGCPNGRLWGGTSVAAPIWGGFAALLNQANGQNLGFLNPLLYPLAGSDAFHDAASMGSEFSRVGLGSPNLGVLHRTLNGINEGFPDPDQSSVWYGGTRIGGADGFVTAAVPADGESIAYILVTARDGDGHTVSDVNVTLAADSANATITSASASTSVANGAAVFGVTSLVPELVRFRATAGGVELNETAHVIFGVPPVASAGIQAFPTLVDANGVAETKITVTVEDALGRPAPDKQIRIEQGAGNSVIRAPDPALTDADGQIEFTATNLLSETITYTAHVVSDDDLPVPGSAEVEFQNGLGGCFNQNPPPAGLNGWSVEPFITGFDTGPLFFGNVNFGNCVGAYLPTFRGDGAFISNFRSGDLFGLGLDGGAAVTPMINHGPTLAVEAVGLDGRLYARRVATTGNFTTGAIFELDPDSGEILRTVAANVTCPHHLVVDPLSGDLFFDNNCTGAGSDDPSVYRIRNPAGPAPLLEQYAVLPGTPNGLLAFAPDGELFVAVLSPQPAIVRISGTDGPQPPAMTTIADLPGIFWLAVAEADENGTASKLAVMLLDEDNQGVTNLADITVEPPTLEPIVAGIGPGLVGPDGCLYGTLQHTVYRFRDPLGGCSFLASGASPMLRLTLDSGLPPVQGAVAGIVATLSNVDPAADFALLFRTRGANNQVLMERTDTDGRALLRYTGINAGLDRIGAEVTLPDGARVVSNQVELDWAPGQASSALSLNETPSGTLAGLLLTVRASLVDVSRIPPAPIGGAVLEFEMDGESCAAITNNLGRAECELPAANIGVFELVAMFAGQPGSGPAEDRLLIFVMDPAGIDVLFRDSFELLVQPR